MRPISEPTVRIELAGEPRWGRLDGGDVVLDDGTRVPEPQARYLAPVDPPKKK